MKDKWRVLNSKVVLDDEWIRVRSDRCITGTGHIVDPYHVLEYGDWVNVIALTSDAQILLVREYRHGAGAVLTGLVAGLVEPGESHLQAAQRELGEETGHVGTMTLLGSYWANPATHTNRVWAYLATDVEELTGVDFDPNEDIEVVRLPLLELLRSCWTGRSEIQGLHLAALYLAVPHILEKKFVGHADLPWGKPGSE
jgi:8-oxo-dGTP pyrophosphatase MutT (NUDIX family)